MTHDRFQVAFDELLASQQAIERQIERTQRQSEDTERKLGRLEGLFHNQWGRLVEALVEPGAVELFRARGLDVGMSARRIKSSRAGRNLEYDVVLFNGTEIVVIEVKMTFRVADVREFVEEELPYFREACPHFGPVRVFGAVAALEYAEQSDRFAELQGLFVVRAQGVRLDIVNSPDFRPREFCG